MDKQPAVVFRNVGQLYFPQTKVECHYSLTPSHQWSSSDWIGIFEVGWSSVKHYYTYTWALVPEGHTEGTDANCCVIFHASYLPRPGAVEYEFIYVDKAGRVCARSRPFTFCAPKPLEELETLKEEQDEDDEEEELLLVIPKAQLLQRRLEESVKKQEALQKDLDATRKEMEDERKTSKKAKMEWERERGAMKEEIAELRDNMRQNYQSLKKMEGKHKDVKYSEENLTCELSKLMAEKIENLQQIRDLNDRENEGNIELERLKERVKKLSCQMKHDEGKRKSLQVENEVALVKVQGLQERLEASEHTAESLRRELRELGVREGHTHTELHQARLQVAQLTLQMSEENLVLREERGNWALEREANKHAAETEKKKFQELMCEVQRMEEWLQEERMERERLEVELGNERDCNRVLLNELQEVRSSQRKAKRERDEHQAAKQELLHYILQLEQRLGIVPETESHGDVPTCVSASSSSEDDDDDASSGSPRSTRTPLFPSSEGDPPDSNTQDVRTRPCEDGAAEGKTLILPELSDPVLSERADSPMW
ncbi:calcium-binding and coiled-coil domain-containing protein 1b isoform X2 [Antennarius striatus]|uniref:calcium-binding and coiled-coil domain-containing protein 1b isoform X2 n=1 Tax=Antennarius striatus TaxID=241820 RepID=UPI0035B0251F